MSSAMDRALMEMSLDDNEEPFEMPDLPEFLSCDRNKLSLIGRVLNPSCQPMKHLIRNMPRKWQKEGRVTGVALTSEKFQFIFDSEHDLEEVLAKGVHTYNDWSIVVDRWYENPPDDYLRYMLLWVQIWNIPVNYYTVKAITKLGDLIGEVKEVVFNPDLPQVQEFVRVKVLFDVSRPLRRSKVINFKNGDSATVHFHYERVQKRCYECQRLTHEKDVCPILVKARQDKASARRQGISIPKAPPPLVLLESNPLFGVLKESQVGLDPNTGRPRIAPEVLEGMRQYLRVTNAEERSIRVDRVIKSVSEAEKDPFTQKTVLQLESLPIVHHDMSREKGMVFGFDNERSSSHSGSLNLDSPLGLEEVSHPKAARDWLIEPAKCLVNKDVGCFLALSQPFSDGSTVYSPGLFESGFTGTIPKKSKQRNRPPKHARKPKPKASYCDPSDQRLKEGSTSGTKDKRKAVDVGQSAAKVFKLNPKLVVPNEGPSNA